MKKLLVVAVAVLVSASAFAQKSMVKLDGCFDGTCDNLDFSMSSNDVENAEVKMQTIALNYAYLFTDNFGAGLTYVSKTQTSDGDKADPSYSLGETPMNSSTIGLSAYWNIDGGWNDTCFAAFHYNMATVQDGDATTDSGWKSADIVLEYGHRFTLGKLAGLDWNWSPSVSYAMRTITPNASANDDVKETHLTINAANFAVAF